MKASWSFNKSAGKYSAEDLVEFFNVAAGGSNLALATLVEKHGPELLQVRDDKGGTALIRAAELGHSGAIHILVKLGADINAADDSGNTALMAATLRGYRSVAQTLLDRGADLELINGRGRTALMQAATHRDNNDRMHQMSQRKKETVKLLLDRGARTEPKDYDGHTAENWARLRGYPDIADMIAAEAKRRRDQHDAEIALYTRGVPQEVSVMPRLRLRNPHSNHNP